MSLLVNELGTTPHLCGGGVLMQDVNDTLEAERTLLLGETEPVPAGEQGVHVQPRLQLRPRRQRGHKVLLLGNLGSKVNGRSG